MKRTRAFMGCVSEKIKKYFFNRRKSDINHACEKLKELRDENTTKEDVTLAEEYLNNYNITTRWQTV